MKEVIISIVIALISSAGFWSFVTNKIEKNNVVNQALGALLRHQLFEIYDKYKDSDTVPHDVQEETDSLYQAYSAMGCNGIGTKIHDEIMRKQTGV